MIKSRTKRYGTVVLTFAAALSIGFVMQYGDAVASRLGVNVGATQVPTPQDVFEPEAITPVVASVVLPQQFELPERGVQTASYPAIEQIPTEEYSPTLDASPVSRAPSCEIKLTATPMAHATILTELDAGCRPNAVVAFDHEGMNFRLMTDERGQVQVRIPALNTEALVIAAFADGKGAVAMTAVPDLVMYDRAVLQWQGESDLQLHALEFGARYGGEGHVWSAAMNDTHNMDVGVGGSFARLGNPDLPEPVLAEIYTYPSVMTARGGDVSLSVEAEITSRNCGRMVTAQTIQVRPMQAASKNVLSMTMPDCEATGEFLVLKNLLEDLTLASR